MGTMHDGEFDITVPLVERLLSTRFPRWADLPLTPVEPSGTDHAIFRLGTDLAVRLPRIGWAADQPAKEHAWLPRLAYYTTETNPTLVNEAARWLRELLSDDG